MFTSAAQILGTAATAYGVLAALPAARQQPARASTQPPAPAPRPSG